jgi:hypothetical protein
MSDELDPNLLRLFAETKQTLPGAEFEAQVLARLDRPQSLRDIARVSVFTLRAALSGITMGIRAPLRLRGSYLGAMAASTAALVLWITLNANV